MSHELPNAPIFMMSTMSDEFRDDCLVMHGYFIDNTMMGRWGHLSVAFRNANALFINSKSMPMCFNLQKMIIRIFLFKLTCDVSNFLINSYNGSRDCGIAHIKCIHVQIPSHHNCIFLSTNLFDSLILISLPIESN